jgi:hypothetical protein
MGSQAAAAVIVGLKSAQEKGLWAGPEEKGLWAGPECELGRSCLSEGSIRIVGLKVLGMLLPGERL